MANLSKKERDALSKSSFGDPGNRLFPITDQDDVDSAAHLIGKAKNPDAVKSRVIAIAKEKGLEIPKAWKSSMTIDFNIESSGRKVDNGYAIYPMSYLFKEGDYPDKQVDFSGEDLWLISQNFNEPVYGNIEHTKFLQGRACIVHNVTAIRDNGDMTLKGEVSVPLGLDELLLPSEKKLSCEFTLEGKEFTGICLCTNPRVPEAALMSYFAANKPQETVHGQQAMQDIHDRAARAGAICNLGNSDAKMTAKPEMKALQAVHDAATAGGADCHSATDRPSNGYYYTNDKGEENKMDDKSISTMIAEGIKNFFTGGGVANISEKETVNLSDPRIASLEQQLANEKIERFKEFAEREIDSRIKSKDGKILPAEREALVAALFVSRKDDDKDNGKVTFSDGSSKTRSEMFLASLDNRPSKNMYSELIAQDMEGAQVLFNSPDKDELAKVRKETEEWAQKQNMNGSKK